MNREKSDSQIDRNGFPGRPALLGDLRGRDYYVVYRGYSADGRIGRINVTASFYAALGEDRNSFFTSKPAEIRAGFGAVELSYDYDWMRFRLSGLYATGDGDPYNNTEGDRKSTRLNSSHSCAHRMPSSACKKNTSAAT